MVAQTSDGGGLVEAVADLVVGVGTRAVDAGSAADGFAEEFVGGVVGVIEDAAVGLHDGGAVAGVVEGVAVALEDLVGAVGHSERLETVERVISVSVRDAIRVSG